MENSRRWDDVRRPRRARIVRTVRGTEERCPEHGHLLAVVNEAGQLVVKCRCGAYVIMEVQATN